MPRKTKTRPEPGKTNSAESVTATCTACGATIHVGDRYAEAMTPVGIGFDGELIGFRHIVCGACADILKEGSEAEVAAMGESVRANRGGVTLQ